ncbi:MAG: valine--tRNA ligase [Candidatus Promineifilaceae bacterium]|nr:valine--tRNA ligase [Candidatus Promineifilaceae bacterium]
MPEMPKTYEFSGTEERLYEWWESHGWFKPETRPADAEPFVISIPPPNVTGELHQGHALFVALEDLMIRRARMQGKAALWVPGTDHAGIATQLQVEKQLMREEGKTRWEIGREDFIELAWAWKERYGSHITKQLRRLGASCDWERERFTLDAGLSRAVREAFVRLYRMGLIYRDEYLVNWSPGLQTAVSDLEVEYSEEAGYLYYFHYPIKDGGSIPVATTRPETILGDTAVAVHPEDERFADYVGKTAIVPIIGREIPVISDTYVDMSFGTGALKITPGHDPNDFEIGQRYDLEIVNVLNRDATMSAAAGPYEGLDRFECRARLWSDMEAAGLTEKKEPHQLKVPRSQRGGEVIEPLVSRQWFVDAEPMAKMALAAVHSGRIQIVPERFVKVWENWLENIQPWCISRQLWWGHRIPVWYCDDCGHLTVAREDPTECERCGSAAVQQDPDVLDTWFSSALWPFSTLGWPDQTEDLRRFYPTDVLETGYDILFFWVARMVMAGTMFTNNIPFHTIYLHGLVKDEYGRKMSKTTGNVVDPLEVMEEYGTDALRFTLLTGGTPGNDLNLAMAKIASNRNFANKLWNVARYIVHSIDQVEEVSGELAYTDTDRWILSRLNSVVAKVNRLCDSHQYGEAGRQIQDFLWGDFADWYVEASKVQLQSGGLQAWTTLHTLLNVLDCTLRLLHPYIPFVTEETWQQLKTAFQQADLNIAPTLGWKEALIIADWPEAGRRHPEAEERFRRLRELVRGIRATRSEYRVEPSLYIEATIAAGDLADYLQEQVDVLCFLARLDETKLIIAERVAPPDNSALVSLGDLTAYLPLAGMVDVDQERQRLEKELEETEAQIRRLRKLLAGPFSERAPAAVVEQEREKLIRYETGHAELVQRLDKLN